MSREPKPVELRHKTDRDLVNLIQRALDRGLAMADGASTKESALYVQAERAHQMVKTWLPLISGLGRDEHLALELKLKELSSALDRTPPEKVQRHF